MKAINFCLLVAVLLLSQGLVQARELRWTLVRENSSLDNATLPLGDLALNNATSETTITSAAELRDQLRHSIAQQLSGKHFDTWLDPARFDKDRIVMQARRLWYYATLLSPYAMGTEGYRGPGATESNGNPGDVPVKGFSKERMEQLEAAAKEAFEDLKKFQLSDGAWLFCKGTKPTDPPQQIHMYGVSFALYALSTYYHATGNPDAGTFADDTFKAINKRLTSSDGGVFPESYEMDFATEFAQPLNALGHSKGRRTVNTHIHMLEALTAYHALVAKKSKDAELTQQSATALERLTELVKSMKAGPRMIELRNAERAVDPAQNLSNGSKDYYEYLQFLPGHNSEATFLVQDAYDVLGKPCDQSVEKFTKEILEETERWMQVTKGYRWLPHIMVSSARDAEDATEDSWVIGPLEWQSRIDWWAQMELLNALVHADKRYGGPGTEIGDEYIQRAAATWELVSKCFVNNKSGALHMSINKVTMSGEGIAEHGEWKASYHSSRALVRSLQALSPGISAPGGDATVVVKAAGPEGARLRGG